LSLQSWATQTENNVLHIVPAPGAVKIDGKTDDWDLSTGVFACDNVEELRSRYAAQIYGMYDKDNLYILCHWIDSEPLNNRQSSKGGYGFSGDSLQIRIITNYKTDQEKVSHWTCYLDVDKISIMDCAYGRKFKDGNIRNAIEQGANQAFLIDADGKGYVQEITLPWKLLSANGQQPQAGTSLRIAAEMNFTAGATGRINIHDIFRTGIAKPDRIFTFQAGDQWGEGVLEKEGKLKMQSVRLSDAREFPAKLENGRIAVDWAGLSKPYELPGFKAITFETPEEGDVSMIIRNSKGEVVRHILSEVPFDKGKHEIKWDGLTTPAYITPGEVVPAGEYTWEAIQHPPFSLTMRGYASSGANQPWESGPTSNWGGDHGIPTAITTDGEKIYLGWSGAEAGKALLGCDLEGNVKWRISFGPACHNSYFLAVDNGIVYNIAKVWGDSPCAQVVRLRAKDGVYDNWEGSTEAGLNVPDMISSLGDKSTLPREIDGMDARDGKIFLSFSRQQISSIHIADWKALAAKLVEDQALSNAIRARIDEKLVQKLRTYLAKNDDSAFPVDIKGPIIKSLNKQISPVKEADDEEGDDKASESKEISSRKTLENYFAGALAPLRTDFIAVCDAKNGKLLKSCKAPAPQAVSAANSKQAYFISAGTSIMSMDLESGAVKKIADGLKDAVSIAVGGDGKIYVGISGNDQQVKIFSADGKDLGSLGKQGGRQLIGKWQPEGMRNPKAMVVDAKNNRIWVMESADNPKRVSVWNLADGKLVKELFGGTHYGASGAAINPLNPDEMVAEGCEWKLDPKTGKADCIGVISLGTPTFAAFCPGANKKLYLGTISILAGSKRSSGLQVYERLSEGVWALRAEWRPDEDGTTEIWSDINGDGRKDANETSTIPYSFRLTGYMGWQGNFNPHTFNVYAMAFPKPPPEPENPDPKAKKKKPAQPVYSTYLVKSDGFTACGAPKWDLADIKKLEFRESMRSGCSLLPSKDEKYLLTVADQNIDCFDLKEQKKIWSYPNTFSGVHGSHRAPPPTRGVTRGIFGVVGTFNTPETGNVWAMNGNSGEWYLLTDKGYYLSHLFESDSLKITFPEKALPGVDMTHTPPGLGGEDFGGTLTQGIDGKVYVQAGKIAAWNLLLSGLDKVKAIGKGKVEISESDLALARAQREEQLQASTGAKSITIKKQTVEISGDFTKDFKGIPPVRFQKSEDTKVALYTAWDDNNLYLAWDVADSTPWANGAVEFDQMYVAGDTVDFQFASDPKAKDKRAEAVAGDFRISIGNFKGKPAAVIYRAVSDVKKPKSYSSGVIAHYEMQYVDLIPDAKIAAKSKGDAKGYVVEAAIPWSALGFKPAEKTRYLGDFGVTYGNDTATRTRLRNYWSNQETGLVDDVVFELKMSPKNWGDIFFE